MLECTESAQLDFVFADCTVIAASNLIGVVRVALSIVTRARNVGACVRGLDDQLILRPCIRGFDATRKQAHILIVYFTWAPGLGFFGACVHGIVGLHT